MTNLLEEIIAHKRGELEQLRSRSLPSGPEPRPLRLRRRAGEPLRVIAEIKFRSPSAGALSTALSVGQRACAYQRAGASMVSVLCDQRYFGGGYEHLVEARAACQLPLLCKEFIIDPVQLDAARASGADAVLLIARCLDQASLEGLTAGARARGLAPLVEIANAEEAGRALAAGADLIGVNARDLNTLEMDLGRAHELLAKLPQHVIKLHLSGISNAAGTTAVAAAGTDAVLIGEALMRQDDPEPLLRDLVASGS